MRGHDFHRRAVLGAAGAIALWGRGVHATTEAPARSEAVSDGVLAAVLSAGHWSVSADDNGGNERMPESALQAWVGAATVGTPNRQAIVDLGALTLTLSVAEWGVDWKGAPPPDPASDNWAGPSSIRSGKHLMSYALGGIGLPHFDAGDGPRFFRRLAASMPDNAQLADYVKELPADFRFDRIRAAGGMCDGHDSVLKTDIFGEAFHHDAVNFAGDDYCQAKNAEHVDQPQQWQKLRSWARLGLRRKDMQRWIVDTWINRYWLPAYGAVMSHPHGSLREAFVVARIWNSGAGLAKAAMDAAGASADPAERVQIALDKYAENHKTYARRRGVMQRPFAVYEKLAGAT
jgi:hypothetical protein